MRVIRVVLGPAFPLGIVPWTRISTEPPTSAIFDCPRPARREQRARRWREPRRTVDGRAADRREGAGRRGSASGSSSSWLRPPSGSSSIATAAAPWTSCSAQVDRGRRTMAAMLQSFRRRRDLLDPVAAQIDERGGRTDRRCGRSRARGRACRWPSLAANSPLRCQRRCARQECRTAAAAQRGGQPHRLDAGSAFGRACAVNPPDASRRPTANFRRFRPIPSRNGHPCAAAARRYFDEELFADPAWDMMLDLLQAEIRSFACPVSSLCIAAAVPATTALRWLKTLVSQGLFLRRADPHDGRRVFVELAPDTSHALRRYFAEVGPGRRDLSRLAARRPPWQGGARGRLAQLVEHLVYTERVGGSSPSPPTRRPSPSGQPRRFARLEAIASRMSAVSARLVDRRRLRENRSRAACRPSGWR